MIFVFDDCELDLDRFELRRAGGVVPVEPQVFDVLAVLVRERARVVPKEELLDTVWGSRYVTESALTSRIKAGRRAIGDDGQRRRWPRRRRRNHRRSRYGSAPPPTAPGWRTPPSVAGRRW